MIRLEITGETSKEFLENLFAASAALGGNAQPAVEEPGKPARTTRKTAPASSDTSADGNAAAASTAGDQTSTSSTSSTATSGASPSNGPISREDVQKKCVQYGQPSKGGPAALSALLTEIGAEGKWSKVTEDMLPALNARLDDLLA